MRPGRFGRMWVRWSFAGVYAGASASSRGCPVLGSFAVVVRPVGGLEQRVAVVVLPLPLFAPGLVLWTAPVGLGGPGLCWDAGKPLCISV